MIVCLFWKLCPFSVEALWWRRGCCEQKVSADSNERDMQCDAMDAAGRFYGPNTWRVMSTVVCLCTYLPYTYLPAYHPTTCAYY